MRTMMSCALALLLGVCWAAGAVSADKAQKADKAKADAAILPYPLDKCLVTGEKLGTMGEPVKLVYEGREIKFCCSGCQDKFKADPKKYLKALDGAIIEQQKATYPTDMCIVMGKKLGDKPIDYVYQNRLIRFCCKWCVDSFKKDPQKYLKILDDAVAAKAANPAAPKDDKKK